MMERTFFWFCWHWTNYWFTSATVINIVSFCGCFTIKASQGLKCVAHSGFAYGLDIRTNMPPFFCFLSHSIYGFTHKCILGCTCSMMYVQWSLWSVTELFAKLLNSCLPASKLKSWFCFPSRIWPFGRPFHKSQEFRCFSILVIICLEPCGIDYVSCSASALSSYSDQIARG